MPKLTAWPTTANPELIALAKRYWAHDEHGSFAETEKSLLPEMKPFMEAAGIHKVFAFIATISIAYVPCSRCGNPVYLQSRAEYRALNPQLGIGLCQECTDRKNQAAAAQQDERANKLRDQVGAFAERQANLVVNYHELDDDIAILTLALARTLGPKFFSGIFHLSDCKSLSPTNYDSFAIKLHSAEVIAADVAKSKKGAFYLDDEGRLCWYPAMAALFMIPEVSRGKDEGALDILQMRTIAGGEKVKKLWMEYAVEECMAYLDHQTSSHDLRLSSGDADEMRAALHRALSTFSIAELWSAIWRVTKDAAALSTQAYYNKPKAAATIPGKLTRFLEKVAKGDKNVGQWDRPHNQPAGTIGQIFGEIFGIDENTPADLVAERLAHGKGTTGDRDLANEFQDDYGFIGFTAGEIFVRKEGFTPLDRVALRALNASVWTDSAQTADDGMLCVVFYKKRLADDIDDIMLCDNVIRLYGGRGFDAQMIEDYEQSLSHLPAEDRRAHARVGALRKATEDCEAMPLCVIDALLHFPRWAYPPTSAIADFIKAVGSESNIVCMRAASLHLSLGRRHSPTATLYSSTAESQTEKETWLDFDQLPVAPRSRTIPRAVCDLMGERWPDKPGYTERKVKRDAENPPASPFMRLSRDAPNEDCHQLTFEEALALHRAGAFGRGSAVVGETLSELAICNAAKDSLDEFLGEVTRAWNAHQNRLDRFAKQPKVD